jgi:hypothetical protein
MAKQLLAPKVAQGVHNFFKKIEHELEFGMAMAKQLLPLRVVQ